MTASLLERCQLLLLAQPPLAEFVQLHPDVWDAVNAEVSERYAPQHAEALLRYKEQQLRQLRVQAALLQRRAKPAPRAVAAIYARMLRARLALYAIENFGLAMLTRQNGGVVRLNRWNAALLHLIFFHRALERKPVSPLRFRCLWRWVSQKSVFLYLVAKRGMYGFYAKPLLHGLLKLLDPAGRNVEIGAGDGTLARFLQDAGGTIQATDDQSWSQYIRYPAAVEKLSAREALKRHQPVVVLCSWPPAGNDFERQVFSTPSVQRYVVIQSRHRYASGNWQAYAAQQQFTCRCDAELSRHVLPPELDAAVYVFERHERN